eukprot:1281601-Pyramimonas_sp.AAC.1
MTPSCSSCSSGVQPRCSTCLGGPRPRQRASVGLPTGARSLRGVPSRAAHGGLPGALQPLGRAERAAGLRA